MTTTLFKNEVALVINDKRFRFWTDMRLTREIDNVDTLEISAPFDPSDSVFRSAFKPFTYAPVSVTVNDETLFTGTMASVAPDLTKDSNTVSTGVYSNPGVLNECTFRETQLPLEYNGLDLHQIALEAIKPWELLIDTQVAPGNKFRKVKAKPTDKVLPFLADLAKERNQMIASTETGALLFWQAVDSGKPVAFLQQGLSPMTQIRPQFNAGQYYVEITGLKSAKTRSPKSERFTFTLENHAAQQLRCYVYEVEKSEGNSLEDAVTCKAARMIGDSVNYEVTVATWRDKNGDLWAPNTIVNVEAPGVMIYNPYDFLLTRVVFERDNKSETATLTLTLPGAFKNAAIGGLPWDE